MTKGFAKYISQSCAVIALLVSSNMPQAQAASLDDILKTYTGAYSNVAGGNQTSKVAQALYYYAVNGSGECNIGATAGSTGGSMAGCTKGNDGKYYNYTVDTGNPLDGYDDKKIYSEVAVDMSGAQVKSFLQNMYKAPPSEGATGHAHYGNFDAFIMSNNFTAAEATEMVGWVYGDNMAAAYAKNLAEQGIIGNKVLANAIHNNGKPGGLQTFYGVLDQAENMGAMMEDQIKSQVTGTIKAEVKDLLAKAGIADMNQLDKLTTAQLESLAKAKLGVDFDSLTESALGKVSDSLGFDVSQLSGASLEDLKAMGVSDLAIKQFEAGILNNYKNLAFYDLEGAEGMWNFDTNALFDTVGLDSDMLEGFATDELASEFGLDDWGDLEDLEGDDLTAALGDEYDFSEVDMDMIDEDAFEEFSGGDGIFSGGGSSGGAGGSGGGSGGSTFSSGSSSGWKIM